MRVLVVEDQAELRQAIARTLRAEGHAVDELERGEPLAEYLSCGLFDVVVLDRMLPDGDALGRLSELRRGGNRTPVLFLSSKDTLNDRVAGLEAGGDDYLVKPFAMQELTARLRSLVRRRDLPQPSVLTIGSLEIDLGRREVRREGVLIPLRPKEMALLELFASRPGQVVSKEQILDWCWDSQHEPGSNVEEVLVASLRRKLALPGLLETVRGAGYRLEH